MNRIKSLLFVIAVFSVTICMAFPAFASKAIKSLTLSVQYSEYEQEDPDDDSGIKITVSGQCFVQSYDVTNQQQVSEQGAKPEMVITLEANEDYYFSITKASQMQFNGCTYKSAKRQDSSSLLVVTVTVDQVKYTIGDIEEIKLAEDGRAMWEHVDKASSYEVRVFRNDRFIASEVVTSEAFSLAQYLTRAGDYKIRARGIHHIDANVRGDWVESNDIIISEEQATINREALAAAESAGEWIQDAKGWRFKLPDGTFVTCAWRKINNEWYYFGADTYMQVGWVQYDGSWYYMDTTLGSMWYNRKSPEGFEIGIDGKAKR
ncbi:MAG: hypothetical protein Q4E54_08730 [Lachnospiraceae bacterium]|nr:hypothetical protein [Lachnospiraceae bacterium]